MRKIASGLIGILVTCGTVYTAVGAENPPTAAPPAVTAPMSPAPAAAAPATPAAATAPTPPAVSAAPTAAAPATPAASSTTAPPAAAASVNLSGKWSSNLVGEVTLEQKGDKITGVYQYDDDGVTQDGKIEGLVKDKTIQAKWWSRPKVGSGEESRGDLEWKIADDGKMLVGWYREEGEKEKQDMNLTR